MKTNIHFLSHLIQFSLVWKMFQIKVAEKIKTHILCFKTFSRKSCRLWHSVEKYGVAGEATDDNIIRRMRFACWKLRLHTHTHTHTHLEYVIPNVFPRQQWLRERASMLRYTYTVLLVTSYQSMWRHATDCPIQPERSENPTPRIIQGIFWGVIACSRSTHILSIWTWHVPLKRWQTCCKSLLLLVIPTRVTW